VKSNESAELLSVLYHYYDKHSKLRELFEWAAKEEVESASMYFLSQVSYILGQSTELCRSESIFPKLLYILLGSDLGTRFLGTTLIPMLTEIRDKYSKVTMRRRLLTYFKHPFTNSEEDVNFLLELIGKFVYSRKDLVHICPLYAFNQFISQILEL
jgi:hypothetical protein